MTSTITIVGGGFAGFWAAMAARRVAGESASVMLVSREPVLQMRPRLYEARPETLGVDLLPLLEKAGVQFIQGDAVGIDVSAGALELATGELVGYSRLVVATGSVMRRPPVVGAELAYSIDTQGCRYRHPVMPISASQSADMSTLGCRYMSSVVMSSVVIEGTGQFLR